MIQKKEILFLWDGENWNPNGDMLNDNAPRIDEETGVAEATDVRIKRTIRDELIKKEGEDAVFIKEYKRDENILDCKTAIRENGIDIKQSKADLEKEILSRFIDIRAFGGVLPVSDKDEMKKDKEITTAGLQFTGPVQFRMSKSLHRVSVEHIKGTGAFASDYSDTEAKKQKQQATFREEDFLQYALFATYGVMDNYNAKKTDFSEEDAQKVIDALWYGTKNLITRSKMGQTPRFMLVITYKDDRFAGDLNNNLDFIGKKDDEAIRNIQDYTIDFTRLKAKLARYAESIEKIEYFVDYDFEQNHKDQFESDWIKIER
ncbi:CRISPR-associated protein, Csh2 family [Nitratifractor salsuginis DSM 16511]|uniref:CRISPR-associated protein, Csh2 family n=1 Tax=Nitratifractor salsuginis (strain DSM 16511 / JCM 12458 / E9I37-1) TaxID=749222 RepID=E6WXQ0_NITSE|nr:type I-B CRISPR-associated protein Cas7/Csh2 [Nitratifractor salsuginis]ADV46307.1 CRISPR-associated protein, Csh2 family [Nitratifractor salsuginis DSM 16511]